MQPLKRVVAFGCEAGLRSMLRLDPHRVTLLTSRLSPAHAPLGDPTAHVLVIAEVSGDKLEIRVAEAISCARHIGGEVEVVLLSTRSPGLAAVASQIEGVARVLEIEATEDPADLAWRIGGLVRSRAASHVLVTASAYGKALMACLGGLLGVPVISDVMQVLSSSLFVRPRACRAIVTVEATQRPVLATVRLGAFDARPLPNLPHWRTRVP